MCGGIIIIIMEQIGLARYIRNPYNLLLLTNVQHVRSVLWGRMMFHSTITTVIPPMGAQCARLLQCCVMHGEAVLRPSFF